MALGASVESASSESALRRSVSPNPGVAWGPETKPGDGTSTAAGIPSGVARTGVLVTVSREADCGFGAMPLASLGLAWLTVPSSLMDSTLSLDDEHPIRAAAPPARPPGETPALRDLRGYCKLGRGVGLKKGGGGS